MYGQDENGAWGLATELWAADGFQGRNFGKSIAVSAKYLVVGAAAGGKLKGPGACYVYGRTENGWEATAKLVHPMRNPTPQFGASVAVSGDFIYVATGGEPQSLAGFFSDDVSEGYLFQTQRDGWRPIAAIVPSEMYDNGNQFGDACFVGDLLVFWHTQGGHPTQDNGGVVHIFNLSVDNVKKETNNFHSLKRPSRQ